VATFTQRGLPSACRRQPGADERRRELLRARRQHRHGLLHELGRRVAEQALDGRVRVAHEAASIDREHRHRRTLEDPGQERGGLAQLAVARLTLHARAHDADEDRGARLQARDANAVDLDRHPLPVAAEQVGGGAVHAALDGEAVSDLVELGGVGEVALALRSGGPRRVVAALGLGAA
jgi:hypothetical protein